MTFLIGSSDSGCELGDRRLAVQLLREHAAGAHQAAHLVGDVDGQADDPALVGERARDRLPDPPGRVGRELEAHLVVELLDGADEPEVALLDQVEERHAGLRVVPGDRHHEPEVALDQAALGGLVAHVLPPGELALLGRGQEPAVADLADVELERVLGGRRRVEHVDLRPLSGSASTGSRLGRSSRRGSRASTDSAGSGKEFGSMPDVSAFWGMRLKRRVPPNEGYRGLTESLPNPRSLPIRLEGTVSTAENPRIEP